MKNSKIKYSNKIRKLWYLNIFLPRYIIQSNKNYLEKSISIKMIKLKAKINKKSNKKNKNYKLLFTQI